MKGVAEMYPTAFEKKTHALGMKLCWSEGLAMQSPISYLWSSATYQKLAGQGEVLRTLLDEGSDHTEFGFFQRSDKLVRSQQAIAWHDFQREGKLCPWVWKEKYFLVT